MISRESIAFFVIHGCILGCYIREELVAFDVLVILLFINSTTTLASNSTMFRALIIRYKHMICPSLRAQSLARKLVGVAIPIFLGRVLIQAPESVVSGLVGMRQDKKSCECLFFFVDEMYACLSNAYTAVCMYDKIRFLVSGIGIPNVFLSSLFGWHAKHFSLRLLFQKKTKTKQNHWLLDPPPQTETLHKCRHFLLAKIVCKPPSWRR